MVVVGPVGVQRLVHGLDGVALQAESDVGVDAGGGVDLRMAEQVLDRHQVHALFQQQRGPGRGWQDRDGAKATLLSAYMATPIRHVFAYQGFAGRLLDWTRDILRTTLEIVREPTNQRGFAMHPRRWVVERTPACLTPCRRLTREYERHPEVSEAIILWAAITGMTRPITRQGTPHAATISG